MARICYIHIGTHKTGTSYLQTFLNINRSRLAQDGLCIPTAGRISPLSGHHNIAWELNQDDRYSCGMGSLSDLTAELADARSPLACISSEDFEYLYRTPDSLRILVTALQRVEYTTKAIVYLRPQLDYAESLYAELLKHGLRIGFGQFLDTVISHGVFNTRDRWWFAFQYSTLLDSYADIIGRDNLIVRAYHKRAESWLVTDFMSRIFPRWRLNSDTFRLPPQRENVALPPSELLKLLGKEALLTGDTTVDRFEPITLGDAARGTYRFAPSNWNILRRYSVPVPALSLQRLAICIAASTRIGHHAKSQTLSNMLFRS